MMKRSFQLVCVVTAVGGCSDGPLPPPEITSVIECTAENKEKLAPWILECIRNANPKSDEEPEDWIGRCESMGRRTVCDDIPAVLYRPCHKCSLRKVPCKDVTNPRFKAVCPEISKR